MKKIVSILLTVFMLLSTLAVCSLPVSADAAAEGDWEVHLDAFEESKLEDGDEVYVSTPGYKYTDDGFEIVEPTYKNAQAKFTAITKNKVDTYNFSIKVRLDNFQICDGDDAWLSFTFWSEKNGLAQGGNESGTYGYGWSCLVRDCMNKGVYDGKLSYFEGYSSGHKNQPGGWNANPDFSEFTPKEENGYQILEFKVTEGVITINDSPVAGANNTHLLRAFGGDQNLAYFGISAKSGTANLPVKFTVLEMNGVKPTGSDSAEPINREKAYGPMKDASSIPAGVPGVLVDGSLEAQNSSLPSSSQCSTELTDDNTIKVKTSGYIGFVTFSVKQDYSVDIKDFPYMVLVLKNFCTCTPIEGEEDLSMADRCYGSEKGSLWYCAGNVLAPDNKHYRAVSGEQIKDISPDGSEDYYTILYVKIDTKEFEGGEARIHTFRFDYTQTKAGQEFEIVFGGYFRSPEDIVSYTTGREEGFLLSVEDLNLPVDDKKDDGTSTDGPEMDNDEPTTKKPSTTTTEKSGCGSVVGMGAIAVIVVASVAGVVTFKKRKED